MALNLRSNEISKTITNERPATLARQRPLTDGSRYGNAIINLGNLKDDGCKACEAFAVGSPYEDEGRGAVYIYFGNTWNWAHNSTY